MESPSFRTPPQKNPRKQFIVQFYFGKSKGFECGVGCVVVRIAGLGRGPRTTHHPHKRPSSSGGIFGGGGGWCANCRNLRKRQNSHHPQFCTRDVDCQLCGVVRGFRGLIGVPRFHKSPWKNTAFPGCWSESGRSPFLQ